MVGPGPHLVLAVYQQPLCHLQSLLVLDLALVLVRQLRYQPHVQLLDLYCCCYCCPPVEVSTALAVTQVQTLAHTP